jgi:hypothetical protein
MRCEAGVGLEASRPFLFMLEGPGDSRGSEQRLLQPAGAESLFASTPARTVGLPSVSRTAGTVGFKQSRALFAGS